MIVNIGPHTLYLGDAYTIRPQLPWHHADVTDPQYEFDNSGGGKWRKDRGTRASGEGSLCKANQSLGVDRGPGWWAAEPGVVRMVHGLAHGVDRIGALGNGQVPIVAQSAWDRLTR
jgi:hypothetical protein